MSRSYDSHDAMSRAALKVSKALDALDVLALGHHAETAGAATAAQLEAELRSTGIADVAIPDRNALGLTEGTYSSYLVFVLNALPVARAVLRARGWHFVSEEITPDADHLLAWRIVATEGPPGVDPRTWPSRAGEAA